MPAAARTRAIKLSVLFYYDCFLHGDAFGGNLFLCVCVFADLICFVCQQLATFLAVNVLGFFFVNNVGIVMLVVIGMLCLIVRGKLT